MSPPPHDVVPPPLKIRRPSTAWRALNCDQRLQQALQQSPQAPNDADCYSLHRPSEAWRDTQRSRANWAASGPHVAVRPPTPGNLLNNVGFDGVMLNAGAVIALNPHVQLNPGGSLGPGYLGFSPDVLLSHGNHQSVIDAYAGGWQALLCGGLNGSYYNKALHLGARGGGMLALNAQALSCSGDAALPSTASSTDKLYVPHTCQRSLAVVLGLFVGLARFSWLRALGKIEYGNSRNVSYTTHLPALLSQQLDDTGAYSEATGAPAALGRYLQHFYRGVTNQTALPIPPPGAPAALYVGDTLQIGQEHNWTVIPPCPGLPLFFAGLQASQAQRSQITVEHPAEGHYNVTVQLERQRSWRLFGIVPGGLLGDWGYNYPQSETWTFHFGAAAACAIFIKRLEQSKGAAQSALLRQTQQATASLQALPTCVAYRRVYEGRQSGWEIGLRFCLLARDFWLSLLPYGYSPGLGYQPTRTRLRVEEQQHAADGTWQCTHYNLLAKETERHAGGKRSDWVQIKQLIPDTATPPPDAPLLDLVFRATRSRTTGKHFNRTVIDRLNQHFANLLGRQALPRVAENALHYHRDVELRYAVSSWQLQALSAAQVHAMAQPLAPHHATALQQAWQQNDLCERARVLAAFVQAHDLAAMGALAQLLQQQNMPAPLSLCSSSAAYARILSERQRLQRKYARPLQPHDYQGKRAHLLVKRLQEVQSALREMAQTRDMLADDPFLSAAERRSFLQACDKTSRSLRALLLPSPSLLATAKTQSMAATYRQLRRCLRQCRLPKRQRRAWLAFFDADASQLRQHNQQLLSALQNPPDAATQQWLAQHGVANFATFRQQRVDQQRAALQARLDFLASDFLLSAASRRAQHQQLEKALQQLEVLPSTAPQTTSAASHTDNHLLWQQQYRRHLKLAPWWKRWRWQHTRRQLQAQFGKASRRQQDVEATQPPPHLQHQQLTAELQRQIAQERYQRLQRLPRTAAHQRAARAALTVWLAPQYTPASLHAAVAARLQADGFS